MSLYEKLCDILGEKCVFADEPMSRHTTFRIGGPADYFAVPCDTEGVKKVIGLCKEEEVPYYILGNGSEIFWWETKDIEAL